LAVEVKNSAKVTKGNIAQFHCNCCFSSWRNVVRKWRSFKGVVQSMCLRG